MHQNALFWNEKKNQKFSGEGDFAPPQATLHPSPHCFFDKLNTVVNLCQGKFSSFFLAQTPGLFLHGSVLTYTKKRFSKTDDIGADCLIYNLYSPYFILLNMKYTFLGIYMEAWYKLYRIKCVFIFCCKNVCWECFMNLTAVAM